MPKEELLTIEGVVDEILPDGRFGVMLDNQYRIIAYTAGKMRRYRIRSIVGDRVHVEMTPYDLSKGRIVFREKTCWAFIGAAPWRLSPVSSAIQLNTDAPLISKMPSFAPKSAFWRELRAAAAEHLALEASRGRPSIGDPRLQRKAIVIVLWFGLSYGALLSTPSLSVALLAALSLAFAASALGFWCFSRRQSSHAVSRGATNLWAARICSVLLGPSRHFWVHKHQGLHHRQPNVFGWDDDLETRGLPSIVARQRVGSLASAGRN